MKISVVGHRRVTKLKKSDRKRLVLREMALHNAAEIQEAQLLDRLLEYDVADEDIFELDPTLGECARDPNWDVTDVDFADEEPDDFLSVNAHYQMTG